MGGEWEENGENCKEFLDVHTYFITDTVVRSQKIGHKSNFCASVNLSIYYIHIVSCIYIYIHRVFHDLWTLLQEVIS